MIISKAVVNSSHTCLKICFNHIDIFHHNNKYYRCSYFNHNKTYSSVSSSQPPPLSSQPIQSIPSSSSLSPLEILYKKSLLIINNKQYQPINTVDNDIKLKMYALYKQIEDGPLNASTHSKPGFFDPIGRAKYDVWLSLGKFNLNRTYN